MKSIKREYSEEHIKQIKILATNLSLKLSSLLQLTKSTSGSWLTSLREQILNKHPHLRN